MNPDPLKNWLPYKLVDNGQPSCLWLDTFGRSFTEPFFTETIAKCIQGNYSRGYRPITSVEMIKEWANVTDNIEPAFIFHISRCGSTLVTQLLASTGKHVVLSEVPFFDELLRLPMQNPGMSAEMIDGLFAASVKLYGQKPGEAVGSGQKVFIKTDSWHLFFYEQLRRLYPSAPFIALYRRPNEVFRSQKKMGGMHAVQGVIEPGLFGFKPDDNAFETPDTYLAGVLERYFEKCLEIAARDNNFLLLNYNEGPLAMVKKIAPAANIRLTAQDIANMEERSRYHSKKPGKRFSEEAVTEIPACLKRAMELYELTEEKRMARNF